MTDQMPLVHRALDVHVIAGAADEIALTGADGPMTYAQLLHDSASIAGALREIGVATGTPVAVDLPSGRIQVMAVLACARLGAELVESADFTLAGDPVALTTPDTEVPWDVLLRAGRIDPAAAPERDPEGYEQRLLAVHGELFATLSSGGTLT